jgi:cytochrome c-type biogenesis protein CcmH
MNVIRAWRCAPTVIILLLFLTLPATAQNVSDDQVNEVAKQLYCPVCENIPLDVCPTPACRDWRADIRRQLEGGSTPQQVIDDFVSRFGDRVVGTPQDPMLRTLSLATPWIIGLIAVLIAVWTLLRWRSGRSQPAALSVDSVNAPRDEDYYRARIESDLAARR